MISLPSAWTANMRAGLHRHAVEEHGAGAAARRVAADVRPGQAERLAQEVDEEEPGLDVGRALLAVDGHLDSVCRRGVSIAADRRSSLLRRPAPRRGRPQPPLGEDAHDVALVLGRAADVGLRLRRLGGEPGRLLDRLVGRLGAASALLGLGRPQVARARRR